MKRIMKLSIIIVSWNVREYLLNCLRSVQENRPRVKFEIILVDNASSDGTIEAVKKTFPAATVIANKENRGFAAANNQGLAVAKGQYILFLNPDTIVHLQSLNKLIQFMDDNDDVGICGPKLLNEDRTIQPSVRRFPSFRAALYQRTIFKHLRFFRADYRRYKMHDFGGDRRMDVDQVSGAALMTRRSVIDDLGTMDERFFMYYEEVDFCYRVKESGRRIMFVPHATITHLGGRSSGHIRVEKKMLMITSMLKFFKKNRGTCVTGVFSVLFKPAVILGYIVRVIHGLLTYTVATLGFNRRRQLKSAERIRRATVFLWRYSWRLLFKT